MWRRTKHGKWGGRVEENERSF